jgi:hypothetical protein
MVNGGDGAHAEDNMLPPSPPPAPAPAPATPVAPMMGLGFMAPPAAVASSPDALLRAYAAKRTSGGSPPFAGPAPFVAAAASPDAMLRAYAAARSTTPAPAPGGMRVLYAPPPAEGVRDSAAPTEGSRYSYGSAH